MRWAQAVQRRIAGRRAVLRTLNERFSFHPTRDIDTEKIERGGGQVFYAGVVSTDFAIGEKNAGDQFGIDAMIAAPVLGILFENVRTYPAEGRIPGGAVAGRVADNEVGRGIGVRAFVYRRGFEIGRAH